MQELSTLINKCWSGTATAEELQELLLKLNHDEGKLYDIWMKDNNVIPDAAAEVFDKEKVKARILLTINAADQVPVVSLQTYWRKRVLKISMIAAIITGLFFSGWYLLLRNDANTLSLANTTVNKRIILASGFEEKDFKLSDGSEVVLYPNSSLEYDTLYNVSERVLYLKGKAKFSVQKNKEKAFVVHSGKVSTTALGTVFEVHEQKDSTVVSLFEGAVKVQSYIGDSVNTVFLLPGEKVFSDNYNKLVKRASDERTLTKEKSADKNLPKQANHKEKEFVFKQMPLDKVLKQLMDEYKINIHYNKEELAGMMFTGRFEKTENPESILKVITSINNLRLDTDQNVFSIKK